jgi:hypothetical protein
VLSKKRIKNPIKSCYCLIHPTNCELNLTCLPCVIRMVQVKDRKVEGNVISVSFERYQPKRGLIAKMIAWFT